MADTQIHIINLNFQYDNQETPLFSGLNASFTDGWTGIVGPNGSGKSTLARIASGIIPAGRGTVTGGARSLYVDQVPQEVPRTLFDLFSRTDSDALRLINTLSLEYDWPYRWETLSYGERKRSQIAGAAASGADFLILDEPTNHLDIDARESVISAMKLFSGAGVLISHDTDLLDRFCSRILFLPEGTMITGGFSEASAQLGRMRLEASRKYEAARNELSRLRKEESRRRGLAAAQQKKRSKKNLDLRDSDGRAKLDLVRVTGKDGTGGRLLRQMNGSLKRAEAELESAAPGRKAPTGFTLTGTHSGSDTVWKTGPLLISYDGSGGRGLTIPELEIHPEDRIIITGANGTGKSTLLNRIASTAAVKLWHLKQEADAVSSAELMQRFRALNSEAAGRVVSSVTRLGTDPLKLLSSESWSPGETKKLALALAVEKELEECSLILLDEPMNHLDIDSRMLLSRALEGFSGAIIAVSHEPMFGSGRKTISWRMERKQDGAVLRTD